jgi:cobalt-zinc-cadmium efflux system outer membrane protein
LPVYRQKLQAAICEAQFRLNQRRAEFDQKSLDIQYEVIAAAKQVEESRQTIAIYENQLIPTATQNVAAVRANYLASKASFLDLAQAQRQLVVMSERRLEAAITYHRRLAELDRAVGLPALSPSH